MSQDFQKQVEELLYKLSPLRIGETRKDRVGRVDKARDQITKLAYQTALEALGEDDVPYGNELYPARKGAVERNQLRVEAREALKERFGQ